MVNINIQKKDLWLLSAIMVFLVGVGYVIAYGSGQPTVHGHDAGEMDWSAQIPNNLDVQGDIEFGTSNIKLTDKTGSNPTCVKLTLIRKWNSRTCTGSCSSCTTAFTWSSSAQTCVYTGGAFCQSSTCTANSWAEAVCID